MPREVRPIVAALSLRPSQIGGLPCWRGDGLSVVVVGVGPSMALASTEQILERLDPSRVLIAGVAGAVLPTLAVGDVLFPEVVVEAASGRTLRPHASGHPVPRCGVLATVARIGAPVPPGAWAVDMETAAVAQVCESRGVPWDVRRAISDTPGSVGADVASLLRPDGSTDLPAVLRLLGRRPGAASTLARLARDTRRAVAAMTAAVQEELAATRP